MLTAQSVSPQASVVTTPTLEGEGSIRLVSNTGSFGGSLSEHAEDEVRATRSLVQLQYDAHIVDGEVIPSADSPLVSVLSDELGEFEFTGMRAGRLRALGVVVARIHQRSRVNIQRRPVPR